MTLDPIWIAMISLALTVLGIAFAAGSRISALTVKVDTMWGFQLRRMQGEAVNAGFATVNSPITPTDNAKRLVAPLMGPVREFYVKIGRRMSDADLMLEIERRFGDDILRKVVIPNGMPTGAALFTILESLKEKPSQ